MTDQKPAISQTELVALLAMLSATVAFSMDAMLPALPDIGAALSPDDVNRAQLVLGTFVLGMGAGTFFTGPLSDAFGRKPIAVIGAIVYSIAALVAALAPSLETMLIARFVQGVGAAGPRVVAMAIARDLFSGRRMAQIISYVIFVFTLAPIFAPTIGWLIAWAFGWRAIFLSFAVFSIVSMAWLLLRLNETLAPENVRPFRVSMLVSGTREVFRRRQVVLAMIVQTLIFSILFACLVSSQQIIGEVLGAGDQFALWFGFMALLASGASLVNARIIMAVGMRDVVKYALLVHGCFSALFLVAQLLGLLPPALVFPVTFLWLTSNFYLAGFGLGNMNALALEPMGHMAGLATSIITALATIGAAALSAPIGLAYDGTAVPLTAGVLVLAFLAYGLVCKLNEPELVEAA
ncbi:MAG: multidrug effflux MFS transporter [Paracoccaceae bacterium]|nr:multidrug effflux MFS transporter [Paracoccaceae bacterium]